MATWGSKKNYGLPDSVLDAVREVISEKKLDPVDKKAVKKDFDDRKDQDLDNDGDIDSTDKYLHKRRKAISKNIDNGKKDKVDTDPKLDEMKDSVDAVKRAIRRRGIEKGIDSESEFATFLRRVTGHQVPKEIKDEITKKIAQKLKGIPHKVDIDGSRVEVKVSKNNLAKTKSMFANSKRVKVISEEVLDEAMRVLATKGKTKVVTKGDGVAKVMVGGKEVASGDLDDGAGGFFMSRKGEKGQKFFDSAQKIADFYAEEVELTERKDTANLVAKALKKMGVKPNAKEDEVIKKIPDVLKKMGMQQVLNMMNKNKDYRNDMLGDILDDLGGM